MARYVKLIDPSRPILFPNNNFGRERFHAATGMPAFTDIHAKHYPYAEDIEKYARDSTLSKPFLFTEYNHSLDVAFEGLEDRWEIIERYDKLAGGHIWLWADQGLYRDVRGKTLVDSYADINALNGKDTALSPDRRLNQDTIMDSHGQFGTDGIVYADRFPQEDYWETRKVYAPIKITEDSALVNPGTNTLSLTVHNRYDFTDLKQIKAQWQLIEGTQVIQEEALSLNAAPHQSTRLNPILKMPTQLANLPYFLHLRFSDPSGLNVYEHSIRLVPSAGAVDYAALLGAPFPSTHPEWPTGQTLTTETRTLENQAVTLNIAESGLWQLQDRKNPELRLKGPYLRVSRPLTMAELRNYDGPERQPWQPNLLEPKLVQSTQSTDGTLCLEYEYMRPQHPGQKVKARFWLKPGPEWLDIHYELSPENVQGYFPELGISFVLPEALNEFHWLGNGPYAAYPYRATLAGPGIHRVRVDEPYFRGNRSGVDWATLSDPRAMASASQANRKMWQ
ncbi:MAG: hypothetical protein HC880_20375 [Bacteroidia bacterium]|nr:hypothetical protein [Bacteroidia bacterium]